MARKKGSSNHQKALYQQYKINETWKKNRANKLLRHIKAHPNDKNAESAIDRIKYRRNNINRTKKIRYNFYVPQAKRS